MRNASVILFSFKYRRGRRPTAMFGLLTILAVGIAPPPPGCRSKSSATNGTVYQCVLCPSTPPRLSLHTQYFLNARCDFVPRRGVISIASPIVATQGVEIGPLLPDGATAAPEPAQLYGTIHVIGSDVQIKNIQISHRIEVVTSEARNVQIDNVIVQEDTVGFSVDPPDNTHDVELSGLKISNLVVPKRQNRTVATLYHAVGDVEISCVPGNFDRVVVQPMVPSGVSHMPDCNVVNMSAIFDAFGSAYMYDLYHTPTPEWVEQLRQWAITFSIASIILLLVRYSPKLTTTTAANSTDRGGAAAAPRSFFSRKSVKATFANFL